MTEEVIRRKAPLRAAIPEPPRWCIRMAFGDDQPCQHFVEAVLFEAFPEISGRCGGVIMAARATGAAAIKYGPRDILETQAEKANQVVSARRRRYCQNRCTLEFSAEPA